MTTTTIIDLIDPVTFFQSVAFAFGSGIMVGLLVVSLLEGIRFLREK